jgi:hypothetical protein
MFLLSTMSTIVFQQYQQWFYLQTLHDKIKIFYILPPPYLHILQILCNFARIFRFSECLFEKRLKNIIK